MRSRAESLEWRHVFSNHIDEIKSENKYGISDNGNDSDDSN